MTYQVPNARANHAKNDAQLRMRNATEWKQLKVASGYLLVQRLHFINRIFGK